MAVLHSAGVQLLGASAARAILPHLGQLRICFLNMHICLGCFSAVDSNICAGPLGQIHHCLLLRGSLEHCLHGPCGFQVCFAVQVLTAATANALKYALCELTP